MILLIDNYDSFSYNLYQYIGTIDPEIKVIRNDEMSVKDVMELKPSHIIISPGPGRPSQAGICEDVVREAAGKVPILGVCLGHQAIFEAFGGRITYAKKLMHGKQSTADIDTDCPIFRGLPGQIKVARYHSLAADEESMPQCLKVVGRVADKSTGADPYPETDDAELPAGGTPGDIMAIAHRDFPVYGVQFHPESILTPDGMRILRDFLH